ncbi:MAG: B12-binding domain-containing radical SAM protein [SAR202 cluster bacterium]|nr:B12-binding domain-containing radical SAM protein [SAR202 cluster bacterium]
MSRFKKVVLVQPRSPGGNFEYVAIPRQGMLFLSGALQQWQGPNLYERMIWFEDRSGKIDPQKDLEDADVLLISALINEAPRAYEIAREAKERHPKIVTIGGGPHMSPLADEAIREGGFDVIVQREGEDIIGQLCDVLLAYKGQNRLQELKKIPGIAFMENGGLVQTTRRGLVEPDFVELPDFYSIKDLTPSKPLMGGVMETVRGCTEKCSYCQVIQQFLGYRMVKRETELKRLAQLSQMAADGLIATNRDGRFSIFVSDDLHPPPLRAVKYRNERLERIKAWKGHTDDMYLICQTRAEIGQDPELADALRNINMEMLYVGVESSNADNLKAVNKRQDPGQMHKGLTKLNELGFAIVAMTIIGLPYDTEEGIMEMADWVTQVSKYQTANLLTPLPATSNWEGLVPLDANGDVLQEGEMRPYHLYTGRQFVHQDPRWGMEESRRLFNRYHAKLNPVDNLYARLFRVVERYRIRLTNTGQEISESLAYKKRDLAAVKKEIAESISSRVNNLGSTLKDRLDTSAKLLGKNSLRVLPPRPEAGP